MAEDTLVAGPPPPPAGGRHRKSTGEKIRFVIRGIGQTLITLGLVVLLFVVYEVWITNIFADREQKVAQDQLNQNFDNGKQNDDPTLKLPGSGASTIPLGTSLAALYLPRLGPDYHKAIVEGSDPNDLEKGPGHYRGTALPGKKGNFAVAGHRVGKGEPFLNLDKLQAGDPVIVETKSNWFVYRVKGTQNGLEKNDADGIPGREVVDPSQGSVLLPVPNHQGAKANERLMTMTTCTPKFTAAQRMIVYSVLDQTVPVTFTNGKRDDAMPASVKALYKGIRI